MKEVVSCVFCGSTESRPYAESNGWNIVACGRCSHRYTNPRPTLQSLPSFYDASYYNDERFGDFFKPEKDQVKKPEFSIEKMTLIEKNFKTRGSLLEIGSARGDFLNGARALGWKVQGVEISKDAVQWADQKYGLKLYCGTLEDFKTDEKFDAICMFQVLEHVPDPKGVLKKCLSLLKPGGVCVIEVPNMNCFEFIYNKKRAFWSYDLPRHLHHFSPDFLKKKVKDLGFESAETYYYPDAQLIKLIEWRNARKERAPLQKPSQGPVRPSEHPMLSPSRNWKMKVIDLSARWIQGWRFTIVARKS